MVSNGAGGVTSDAARLSIAAVALVNHAPAFNSGVLEGSIRQMLGESVALNGSTTITGDLFAPGLPNVILNGSPNYGGTLDGGGAATPTNYTVTLNSNTTLGHVVRRTDPVQLPTVTAPTAPTGTRSVTLNNPSDPVGDWATVRNLTLNSNAGQVAAPAGAYGDFTANGGADSRWEWPGRFCHRSITSSGWRSTARRGSKWWAGDRGRGQRRERQRRRDRQR